MLFKFDEFSSRNSLCEDLFEICIMHWNSLAEVSEKKFLGAFSTHNRF